jgi:hypothetical protein
MLSDRVCQLLTAYVDGELTARQRRGVARLLRRSTEARDLLRQLQEDAGRVRALPPRKLDIDLSQPVLRAIADTGRATTRPVAATAPAAFPAWAGLATAATVLLVIGLGSYLYFTAAEGWSKSQTAELKKGSERGAGQGSSSDGPGDNKAGRDEAAPDGATAEPLPVPPVEVAIKPDGKRSSSDSGSPKDGDDQVFAIPDHRRKPFDKVSDLRLSLILALRQLDQPESARQLKEELQKDPAYHLELFCLDGARALDRMRAVFAQHGVRLLIDADAQALLGMHRKANYVLYADDLTQEELARVLQQLGAEDRKAEANRAGDGQFGKVVVNPWTATDQRKLAKVLGVDPAQLQPARRKAPLGVDIRKPVSDSTGDHVAQALKGQGGKPAAKQAERLALVLVDRPFSARGAASREVKQFLDARKARRDGALQVLFVLRSDGN